MKKLAAFCLTLAVMLGLCCFGGAFAAAGGPTVLEHWAEDSPAMQSIVDFVEKSVDESSDGYIPKEDRIAVFDNDGTLYGERFPTYFNDWLYIQRALYDENYEAPEELKAFARAWEDKVLRGIPIEDFDAKERELGPKLYEGLTPDEYDEVVRRFKELPVWGFEGMTYGEAFFRPMVSLVKYLYGHDYTIYIVSATYRDAVRVLTEGVLDEYIPRDHVIGTDLLYVASGDADKDSMFYELKPEDELVIAGELFLKNQKTNKAAMIQQEIGRMPVLAFGNSTGDFSMATYTLQNEKYGGRAYMLLCDDTERDYGSPETAASFKEKCDANGFCTVSERDEFTTLYGDGVRMADAKPDYTLDKVVVLSRHNIRSPLSGSGSLLGDITPHKWFDWTSNPGELSLRGAILETQMGQYFRLWLEDEGLFPENYRPEEGAVRFYANAKQRTQATARYFSAGLLPVAVVPVECHTAYDTMDPTFNPVLTFCTDEYAEDVMAQIAGLGGEAGLEGIHAGLTDAIELLMDVTDMEKSEAYKSGKFGDLLKDETAIILGPDDSPGAVGPIRTATSVADALTFQYYEMADDKAAAFGHDLTRDDWLKLHSIVDTYTGMLFETPLAAVNVAHPLLQEIRSELTAEGRKFSFLCGHDSNIASVLAALGAGEYKLPDTVEPRTPIGMKLVFETWSSKDGEDYAKVRLVYQSTEQLRGMTPLSLDNPPVSFEIDLPGLERNADGYYRLDDVLDCLGNAIDAYDAMLEKYTEAEAAASEEAGAVDFAEVFPSWNSDSASLKELVAFVSDCTDASGEGYLDPADRIATFDMDGTILCEKAPIYFDYCLTMHRVLDDPTFMATEEEREAMQQVRDHAYATGEKFKPKTVTKRDLVASAFAGMTPEEFRAYVADYAAQADAIGFEGMTYGQSFYKPMLEIIQYLKANDFDVWIVSACEREVSRALVEPLGIPFDHVIATDVPYVASGKGDEPADKYNMGRDELILLGAPLDPVECGQSAKPAAIAREIGKRPVLAFGNSSGDYSMLNYAEGNPGHEGMGFFIVCDDTQREYGSAEKAAEFYSEAAAQGWTAVSMANDWATIYGDGVWKTELPGAEEPLANAA